MRIAFVSDGLPTCGGIITNFEYVKTLRESAVDAIIVANGRNEDLERTFGLKVYPLAELESFTEEDVIIANWWMQVEMLETFKGKKVQFVQGNDALAYEGNDLLDQVLAVRKKADWHLLAVSDYALQYTGKEGKVIPNGLSLRFPMYAAMDYPPTKDIDILIEGNNEPNKNIDLALSLAKQTTAQKIVWLGRETHPEEGVETMENPHQSLIPLIYQRSKILFKFSQSEGFCLPILEAMVSGAVVMTWDMGGNDFCVDNENCIKVTPEKVEDIILNANQILADPTGPLADRLTTGGYTTAEQYSWEESAQELTDWLITLPAEAATE